MIKNPFSGKTTRTRIFTIITIVAIVLVLGLNLAAFAMGIYDTAFLDLTPEGLFTLRSKMIEECKPIFLNEDGSVRADREIKMIFCADPDTLISNYATRPIYHMAIAMSKQFENFKVETVNITYNPTAIADYKTTSLTEILSTDIILTYGQRYRIADALSFWRTTSSNSYYSFDGEYKLATLLMSLTLINQPSAYFVTDHGTEYYDVKNPESKMSQKLGDFVDILTERGLNVKNISIKDEVLNKENPTLPDDCAVLIINNPTTDLYYDADKANSFSYISESEVYDRFLTTAKGSLMIAKDYKTSLPILEEFLYEWGMICSDTLVKDTENALSTVDDSGVTFVGEYNPDEASYAYQIYSEYSTLDSAPRTIVTNTGHITCSFEDSTSMSENGAQNVSRIFAPFLFSSDGAQDYAKSSITGEYVAPASDKGQKVVAATCGRQYLDNVTANYEYAYVFCAPSADFFTEKLLGNHSYANYDVTAALVQSIARLDTYASMELGGTSANSNENFAGKVLWTNEMSADGELIYKYNEEGMRVVDRELAALSTTAVVVYSVIAAIIPLTIAVVGIVVKIKRKYL